MKRSDYVNTVWSLFNDYIKIKVIIQDPTPSRLFSAQKYRRALKHGEITDTECEALRSKSTHFSRAHCLPKIQKSFSSIR